MIGTTDLARVLYQTWREQCPEGISGTASWPYEWEHLSPEHREVWRAVAIKAAQMVAEAAGARPRA